MKYILSSFLIILLLLNATTSYSEGLKCSSYFAKNTANEVKAYGQLKPGFTHSNKYTVEVVDQSEILNQCGLGTCHIHSWVSMLEQNFKSKQHQDLKISTHYLSYQHWLKKSLSLLNDKTENVTVKLGANIFASRMAIYNYGIVPDKIWTFNRKFQEAPLSKRINEYIQNIVANAKWNMSKATSDEYKEKIRLEAQNEIIEVFNNIVGKVPEKFIYENKLYTPQTFLKVFFPELLKPITQIEIADHEDSKTTMLESRKTFKKISASLDVALNTLKQVLDGGQNVYLSYSHNEHFVDKNAGIMSISAFEIPPGGAPLDRDTRSFYKIPESGHAVQIVGYDLDLNTNKIIKLKIKNSWGDKSGENGYFHMYLDYFNAFATGINFIETPDTPQIKIDQVMPQQLILDFEVPKTK